MTGYLLSIGSGVVLCAAAQWAWRKYDVKLRLLRAWSKVW